MKTIILFLFTLISSVPATCWNDNGHMTGGAIAYYYLKQNNPVVLQQVLNSFQSHPFYLSTWKPQMDTLPTQELKDVTLFMLASTWPDKMRNDSTYGGLVRAKWHYIDYPFIPKGQPALPDSVTKYKIPNAKEKLTYFRATIPTEKDPVQKAINLSWLFHITEDIHEPMHTISLFDKYHPTGDAGGNFTYFKMSPTGNRITLHTYWDSLVPGPMSAIPANAQNLLMQPNYSEANLPELKKDTTIDSWLLDESYVLAKTIAYQNGFVNGTSKYVPVVSKDYDRIAKAVGEKQVVLSGIRLAKELIQLYQ